MYMRAVPKKRLLVYILTVILRYSCTRLSSDLLAVIFRSRRGIPRRKRKLGVKTQFWNEIRSILVHEPLVTAFNLMVKLKGECQGLKHENRPNFVSKLSFDP